MFPNIRLMTVAVVASVFALSFGFGLFAAFRVNHEPLARLPPATAPAQLVDDNAAPNSVATAALKPFDSRFQFSAPQIGGDEAGETTASTPLIKATAAPGVESTERALTTDEPSADSALSSTSEERLSTLDAQTLKAASDLKHDGAPAVAVAPPKDQPPPADGAKQQDEAPALAAAPQADQPPLADEAKQQDEAPALAAAPQADQPPLADEAKQQDEAPAVAVAPQADQPPLADEAKQQEEAPAVALAPPADQPPPVDETTQEAEQETDIASEAAPKPAAKTAAKAAAKIVRRTAHRAAARQYAVAKGHRLRRLRAHAVAQSQPTDLTAAFATPNFQTAPPNAFQIRSVKVRRSAKRTAARKTAIGGPFVAPTGN